MISVKSVGVQSKKVTLMAELATVEVTAEVKLRLTVEVLTQTMGLKIRGILGINLCNPLL